MGIADRDYTTGRGRAGGGRPQVTPVVKWLLILNVAIFFSDVLVMDHRLYEWGAFSIESALRQGKLWEFFTFQFLHGSLIHLLFNSVGLYFFGPWMERWWGARRFLVFYLLCGAAGAAFYTLLWTLGMFPNESAQTGLIGASAGIYGILMGVAVIAPNLRVALIFPPIEMSMRQMAMLILAIFNLGFGFWLWFGWGFGGGWLHAKLALVVVLLGYHHVCGAMIRRFANGENRRSHVWYRWFNEAPVLLLVAVVILVVVKPF